MKRIGRRHFLQQSIALTSAAVAPVAFAVEPTPALPRRKYTMDLVGGAIGVRAGQLEAIELAGRFGFESVAPSPSYLATLDQAGMDAVRAKLKQAGLVWGAAGLPVDFRRDSARFETDLAKLPKLATALQRAGGTRMSTWLRPCSDELTYRANFRQHALRLGKIAQLLQERGIRFGLEYVGPKTSWSAGRYPFIHTMAEARELIAEINVSNVGLVLDSWHWYTAGDTEADLLALTNHDVVACDLNDAPVGIKVDEQRDTVRELPAATGVIDVKTFLRALIRIGYDGPVRAEPFNKRLNALDNEAAVKATAAAIRKAFAQAG